MRSVPTSTHEVLSCLNVPFVDLDHFIPRVRSFRCRQRHVTRRAHSEPEVADTWCGHVVLRSTLTCRATPYSSNSSRLPCLWQRVVVFLFPRRSQFSWNHQSSNRHCSESALGNPHQFIPAVVRQLTTLPRKPFSKSIFCSLELLLLKMITSMESHVIMSTGPD